MARRPRIALKVADAIAASIADLPPGTWLPSWRALAEEHGVALATLRNALVILVERGLIENVPTKGSRVAVRFQRDATDITRQVGQWRGFHVTALAAGLDPYTTSLRIGDVPAPPKAAHMLAIATGSTVLERSRVQGLNIDSGRRPVQLSASWILPEVVEAIPRLRQEDTGKGGMGSRMEDIGLRLSYRVTAIGRLATDDEAAALELPTTPYAIHDIWRQCIDQNGRIVEVTHLVVNSDIEPLTFEYG